ncbi:uncharacterized protein B0H18DRAFT_872648 [Fomitopsis serialis]|uniref:uncharacterized protein n=1 Tax=Fomitopsis serialis TaxID=139415 RepID=UPI002007697B|nr:uncharacterized protein B0H18DRAFT_872648 [Neoantrodia serialis]KAH9930920.1 hypothetical protein B0H18DRAFT_872648 [Neoantrodia serialis]
MTDNSATGRTPDGGEHDDAPAQQEAAPATAGQSDVQQVQKPPNTDGNASAGPSKPRHTIRKLVPPRPFPTVPASVSATGPRSAHTEGKNYICITRKTQLGAYLRRCKDVIMKDGYKTLHLSAMGAAIPQLMQLTLSLPGILPHAPDEIRTEVLTGTVQVQDEVIPDDEDEDISYQVRGKSTVSVVITIGDGVDESSGRGKARSQGKRAQATVAAAGANAGAGRAAGSKGKQVTAAARTTTTNQAMDSA